MNWNIPKILTSIVALLAVSVCVSVGFHLAVTWAAHAVH